MKMIPSVAARRNAMQQVNGSEGDRHGEVFQSALAKWLVLLIAQLAISAPTVAQQPRAHAVQTPPLMDRQKEMNLALDACPKSAAREAGIYVLEATGYVKVRDSQNGFTAIVQHALPSSQEPQCMDAEGARTILPRYLMVAELRAQGKGPEEIKRFVADAWAKGILRAPTRPGVDYMLSAENYTPDDKGALVSFPPHVMFYAPYLTNADLGSDGQHGGGPAFVAGEGSPSAMIIVPVGAQSSSEHPAKDKLTGSP